MENEFDGDDFTWINYALDIAIQDAESAYLYANEPKTKIYYAELTKKMTDTKIKIEKYMAENFAD